MRLARTIVLVTAALAAPTAFAQDQPAPAQTESAPSNVTVDFGALPAPAPRGKPSPGETRAPRVPMPRFKPSPEEIAAIGLPPMPRPKPQIELALDAQKPKPPKTEAPGIVVQPPPATPQNPADIATALRGTTPAAPPKVDPTAGFSVLTRVRFQSGRSELGAEAKVLLDALATRLLAGEERVRLAAFSGPPGDSSSDAHRLSLARGLAVRTYLVSKGVAGNRVDVLALGGATRGTSDRVDVLVRLTRSRTG
jgi:outer membrane protein OmpA-like peptidoglycan-associated protein